MLHLFLLVQITVEMSSKRSEPSKVCGSACPMVYPSPDTGTTSDILPCLLSSCLPFHHDPSPSLWPPTSKVTRCGNLGSGTLLVEEDTCCNENTLPSFRSLSPLALKLALIYLWAGLCHPEYRIISASVLKVPQWFMAVIMELLRALVSWNLSSSCSSLCR